ncbi:CPBP family intramembrane glutamic endopeptidase [Paenibacillus nanensis]|uniref:CPBP family intramembrane glutamic endopeptidase n=1 Tax=Paenibacillus nanensis TaxID=393251 RepID=UPI0013C31089|nr:CPBP family intramembrane glutamic endopeptidase [Paenibacillus nanensis]
MSVNSYRVGDWSREELRILYNRLSLLLILLPLAALALCKRVPFIRYWRKPQWNERISVPFIWSGYREVNIRLFLILSLTAVAIGFMPFVIARGWGHFQEVWLLAFLFAFANGLEEMVWRGAMLTRYAEQMGDIWAVAATSLGFGLLHYSVGFPWWACLVYAIGGLYFGGITIKSQSMLPVILWHAAINALMVFGGLLNV